MKLFILSTVSYFNFYLFLRYTTFLPAPCFISNPSSINKFKSVTACFTLRPVRRAYCARLMQGTVANTLRANGNAIPQKEVVRKIRIWTLTVDGAPTASFYPVPYRTPYLHGNSSLGASPKLHEVLFSPLLHAGNSVKA